ncbi:MAG: glucose-6-phosphate isomerase [Woeseiaceae bacterium]|nr:glucose-6-phosphate isomerase [Woeseiaceae bacterium]
MPERTLSARYPTDLPAWQALKTHYRDRMRDKTLRELFAHDRQRPERFSLTSGDLYLDYSKNLLTAETRKQLVRLAREARVPRAIEAMFAGEALNTTEGRAALHTALRAKMSDQVGLDVAGVPDVWRVLNRMDEFVSAVRAGDIRGRTGEPLTDIVNIGIGGSDLGPVMAARALRPVLEGGHALRTAFRTSTARSSRISPPSSTRRARLFIVCSKTFTTLETLTNAKAARAWIASTLGEAAVSAHFAAASTNHEAMDAFGINPDYRFGFWDWVGGRYSLWSAVGLSLALVIGMDDFGNLLAGARRMDGHFRQAPLDENMPVLMALIALWYNNFHGAETHAILPYDNRLDRFPAYLQQLQMESNGKQVRTDGKPVKVNTGQVIWGEAGSNAQHSFYQLLHQGTRFVPVDFILPIASSGADPENQDLAIANCLAQSEALMDGMSAGQAKEELLEAGVPAKQAALLARHKAHPGNRPSNTLLLPALTPETLGQLIALYEHKVFVEASRLGHATLRPVRRGTRQTPGHQPGRPRYRQVPLPGHEPLHADPAGRIRAPQGPVGPIGPAGPVVGAASCRDHRHRAGPKKRLRNAQLSNWHVDMSS